MGKAASKLGVGCLTLFLLPFVLVGLGVFIFLGVMPWWHSQESSGWVETPCTIERAELVQSRDSDGDATYRIEVAYTYRVHGQEHRSDRYGFAGMSTNVGVEGMRQEVARLSSGGSQRCYVDPDDARSAVLSRDVPSVAWFGMIFGLFFGGIPGLILVFTLRGWRRERQRAALGELAPISEAASARAASQVQAAGESIPAGPVTLRSKERRGCGFALLLIFSVIWNVGCWMAFLQSNDTFSQVFLGIFLVVGAGMALLTIHQFLALFNPVPELEIDRGAIRPGESVGLHWSWRGNHRRIMKLTISLVCREEADYRRGTDNHTDKHELLRVQIVESLDVEAEGRATVRLPAQALPSLSAPNNRIVWIINVHGDIPRFPDVSSEFPLRVLPPANGVIEAAPPAPVDGPIRLSSGRTGYRPGDTVAGTVRWNLAEARQRIEVRLFWYTAGKGTVDVGVVDSLVVDEPGSAGEQTFSLKIPDTGPLSCSAQLVSVLWAIELVAQPGGALGRIDLQVGPTGVEMRA